MNQKKANEADKKPAKENHGQLRAPGFFRMFSVPTTEFKVEALTELGNAMASRNVPGSSEIPSGYVYLGQFIVHDISRLARGDRRSDGNPRSLEELEQLRTPAFDLDSVYGSPYGKEPDSEIPLEGGGELALGFSVSDDDKHHQGGDLPRGEHGNALIGDSRNDENLLVGQIHLHFLKLHNYFASKIKLEQRTKDDKQIREEARRQLILHYQEVVLFDFLRRVLDEKVWSEVVAKDKANFWTPQRVEAAQIPVELAVAALRFGHSLVTDLYLVQVAPDSTVDLRTMFELTGGKGITDEKPLKQTKTMDWRLFFPVPDESKTEQRRINLARQLSPFVQLSRNDPHAESNAPRTERKFLAAGNLLRGNEVGLPSGQALAKYVSSEKSELAKKLNIRPLNGDELNVKFPGTARRMFDGLKYEEDLKVVTPLWYYLLAEAYIRNKGKRLGPLGSLIVAESFRALMLLSPLSILKESEWEPLVRATGVKERRGRRRVQMSDLLEVVDSETVSHPKLKLTA